MYVCRYMCLDSGEYNGSQAKSNGWTREERTKTKTNGYAFISKKSKTIRKWRKREKKNRQTIKCTQP